MYPSLETPVLHAFKFAYNFNSAVTFFILYNTVDVPLSANSVVTLLVNSRGWNFLRVVFSQTRNFTVIAFNGWIYSIEFFSHLPWKTEFAVRFSTVLNIFFTIQDFWATYACPDTQSLPWKFSLYWIYFYISRFLRNLPLPWKTKCALNSPYWIYMFYHSAFLSNLRLPWKIQVALKCFTVLKYFSHSGFLSNLRVPWKQGFPWIHCIEYIFLSFRIFEQLAFALKNTSCPDIFHCIEMFLSFRSFEQLAIALKTFCPEIFQDRWATAPLTPPSYGSQSRRLR